MTDQRIRSLLNRAADSAVEVDVESAWAELVARAGSSSIDAPARGSDAPAAQGRRAAPRTRARTLVLRLAAVTALAAALATGVVLARSSHRAPGPAKPTTIPPVTSVPRRLVYRPTGETPSSFVAFVQVPLTADSQHKAGAQEGIWQIATTASEAEGLALNPGIAYAQEENGVVTSPDGGQTYYLDLTSPSPPGPGIGIYRIPSEWTGRPDTPSLVAYGTDPAPSPDGRFLAFQVDGGQEVGIVDLSTSQHTDFELPSLFSGRLSGAVVTGLVWLGGTDDLVALTVPGKSSPAAPVTMAVVSVTRAPRGPVPSGLQIVAGPGDFSSTVSASGPVPGTFMQVGRSGTAADGPYPVMLEAPLSGITQQVGELPAGCSPLAIDPPSGSVLCLPGTSGIDVEVLGRSGRQIVPNWPSGLFIRNAAW